MRWETARPAYADLHVHVGRAGGRPVKMAASPRLTLEAILDESVRRKGLDVVGIVDAASPLVLDELEAAVRTGDLEPLGGGGLRRAGPRPLLTVPASEVEADEPDLGPVHYVVYLPDLQTARGFSAFLRGRVSNVDLGSQKARATGDELARWAGREGGFMVPAHVFTPHKGFFGQGGTDLSRRLSDRALEAVPAVELGLSADSAMAALLPCLDAFTFLSNSDAHSPETIAREHNALDPGPAADAPEGAPRPELDFRALAAILREGRVRANYGLDPRLGKYHRSFCPRCGFTAGDVGAAGAAGASERTGRVKVGPGGTDPSLGGPKHDEAASRSVCPACGRPGLVRGVLDRVLDLAGPADRLAGREAGPPRPARPGGGPPRPRPPYVHQVPLRDVPGVGPATLRHLLEAFGTETTVLHEADPVELARVAGGRVAALILAARGGTARLDIIPGAGGRYGRLKADRVT